MGDIDPTAIRSYLNELSNTRNPGGCHAAYRAIKAFLRWHESEVEPENWKNPIKKVIAPKVHNEPLPGVSMDHVKRLLVTCEKTFIGQALKIPY